MPIDIFDQIDTGKRRDIFDDIGGKASDNLPVESLQTAVPRYVPPELLQAEEQAAIERGYTAPAWANEAVEGAGRFIPQAMKFPGKLALAAGAMQTGRLHWPTDEEVQRPAVSPEQIKTVMPYAYIADAAKMMFPKSQTAQIAAGVTGGMTDAMSGFTSSENLATLPFAPAGKLAQRAIAGTFLGQAISGTPEQWEAFNNAPDLTEKIRIATSMGLGYALPALGAAATFRKPGPKIVEPVRTTQEQARDVSSSPRAAEFADETPLPFQEVSALSRTQPEAIPENIPVRSQPDSIPPRPSEASQKVASVPVMITKQMEADLRARGITEEQIYRMTPAEAHEILSDISSPIRSKGAETDPIGVADAIAEPHIELKQATDSLSAMARISENVPDIEMPLTIVNKFQEQYRGETFPKEQKYIYWSESRPPSQVSGYDRSFPVEYDARSGWIIRDKPYSTQEIQGKGLLPFSEEAKEHLLNSAAKPGAKIIFADGTSALISENTRNPSNPVRVTLFDQKGNPTGHLEGAVPFARLGYNYGNKLAQVRAIENVSKREVETQPQPIEPGIEAAIAEIQRRNAPEAAPSSGQNLPSSREAFRQSRTQSEATPEIVPDNPRPEITPTSTKNATTFAERERVGLPEAEQAARRDFGTVWDEAEAVARTDVEAPRRLVDSLFVFDNSGRRVAENPRALTDRENALLLRRQIEVQNEHSEAVDALNAAPDDPVAIQRLETARRELQTVYDATKAAGTETGRGLNARKMLANQDFTLARMEAETRAVANNGRPLNAKQAAEVKTLWERVNKAEARIAEYEAMADFRKSVQTARQSRVKPFSAVSFLEEKAAAARERIIARRGKLYADPLGVTNVAHLADEAIIGAAHIAKGLKNFKDWSSAMLKDFGDGIKPYLQALFAKSQGLHSEAARLSAAKSRTVTETVKTMSRIGAKDFEPRRIEPVKPDKELMALRGNLQRAKDIYFQKLVEARERNRPLISKVARGALKTINTGRALKTSGDISAVGRQGGWIGAGHPILAAKNIKPMFEAMRSAEGQYRIEQEIKAHPDYARAKQAKLELTEISDTSHMTKAEEAYMNSWADKIPGVAGSQRAYVTYLNKLRMDAFSALSKDLSKSGKATAQEARIIANYVNVATGRGYVGKWAGAFAGLNHVFFAPRYVLSRFQLLLGQPLFHQLGEGSPRVRALIAKEYARSLAGTATVIGLGVAAGATFNVTDPRSPDFLKLKFGNSRLDPFYGLQQSTVFLNRLGYNLLRVAKREKVGWKDQRFIGKFVRSKLAPMYGSGYTLASGTDYLNQPASFEREAIQSFTPLAAEGIIEAMEEQGIEKGAALSMLSLLGMGLQTYDAKKKKTPPKTLEEAMAELRQGKIKEFLTGK